MQNFPDHEFDAWIKKSLDKVDLDFDPDAWKLMEKKLDALALPWWSMWLNNLSIVTSALIILYLLLLDVNFIFSEGITQLYQKSENQITTSSEDSILSSQLNTKEKVILDNLKQEENNALQFNDSKTHPGTNSITNQDKSEKLTSTLKLYKSDNQSVEQNKLNKKIIDLNSTSSSHEKESDGILNTNDGDINNFAAVNLPYINPKTFDLEMMVPFSLTRGIEKRYIDQSSSEKEQVKVPKLSVNLFLSPDISSVNFQNVKGTGLNTGISLEYYFSSRWRISAGIIKSNKIYDVKKESGYGYSPPSQLNLDRIEAVCSVLDVPINIRYNVTYSEKGSFFISSGLSSYFMLQEDYEYKYKNYNSSYSDEISIRGENQHIFQILNLSIGYEKELGKRFSIQGEPFFKIPLNNVGYGKVRLITTGAFLSVKYKMY